MKKGQCQQELSSSGVWSNGDWTISWLDIDTVHIQGPYGQETTIHGGDFENLLSAMCSCIKPEREEQS